jgi:hypothetical protein
MLVGTSRGAFELLDGRLSRIGRPPGGAILTRALPMDARSNPDRVLLSAGTDGLYELERDGVGGWRVVEGLRPAEGLPAGHYGDARYRPSGGLTAVLHSQGLLIHEGGQSVILTQERDGLHGPYLSALLSLSSGDIWVSFIPGPFGEQRGAVQILRDHRVVATHLLGSGAIAIAGWIEVPERGSVFVASRIGVYEMREDGFLQLLAEGDRASAIVRDARTGTIGAVNRGLERWDGERFIRLIGGGLYHPRYTPGTPFLASTGERLGIASELNWYISYLGAIVVRGPEGGFLNILDTEDGIPVGNGEVLAHPATGDLFVGSVTTGMAVVLARRVPFFRGDSDADGRLTVTDALLVLNYLFLRGPRPGCIKTGDSNDDGRLDVTDPVYLLQHIFLGGFTPPEPGSTCGPDPTPDALPCSEYPEASCGDSG